MNRTINIKSIIKCMYGLRNIIDKEIDALIEPDFNSFKESLLKGELNINSEMIYTLQYESHKYVLPLFITFNNDGILNIVPKSFFIDKLKTLFDNIKIIINKENEIRFINEVILRKAN